MTKPNPLERPKRPQSKPSPATARPNATKKPLPQQQNGGRGNNRGNGGNGRGGNGRGGNGNGGRNNQPPTPSPWLDPENPPQPGDDATFVEYLRWMRSPDHLQKNPTKVQILQMAAEGAKYHKRLQQLNDRTKLIAGEGNHFQVKCSWRVRVGGHRGPESILLPAFDALGMPFIPSSTLRGVARNQAIREMMKNPSVDWKQAENMIAPWFGSLDAKGSDRCGKVIFLDAYPLPNQDGLTVDMTNNIWQWKNDLPEYSPNPNPFLSLKEATFLIGVRLASGCQDEEILTRVKNWLSEGLKAGIGAQVNTGYGEMLRAGAKSSPNEFFRVDFDLKGQLIHGQQKFLDWKWNYNKKQNEAEVRPVAFKSMLRYWFRVLALGVLPVNQVKEWEAQLFGGIDPQKWGWIKVNILEGKVVQESPLPNSQGKNQSCGEETGILTLSYAPKAPANQQQKIASLLKTLTWLMFHLGGVGQGARRPCYSRNNAPWYRGSTLIPNRDDSFWSLPETLPDFQQKFQEKLRLFYQSLSQLDTQIRINQNAVNTVGRVTAGVWQEAIDSNCKIVVVRGESQTNKPYALEILHEYFHELENQKKFRRDAESLCGGVKKDKVIVNGREIELPVKPSPIWIADLGDYQVVTVFGANQNPRREYLNRLTSNTSPQNYQQIFPF